MLGRWGGGWGEMRGDAPGCGENAILSCISTYHYSTYYSDYLCPTHLQRECDLERGELAHLQRGGAEAAHPCQQWRGEGRGEQRHPHSAHQRPSCEGGAHRRLCHCSLHHRLCRLCRLRSLLAAISATAASASAAAAASAAATASAAAAAASPQQVADLIMVDPCC